MALVALAAIYLGWQSHIVRQRKNLLESLDRRGAFLDVSDESREMQSINGVAGAPDSSEEHEQWKQREACRPNLIRLWMGDVDIVALHSPNCVTGEEWKLIHRLFPEAVHFGSGRRGNIEHEVLVRRPKVPPIRPGVTITNSMGMKLTLIPAGEFLMGTSMLDEGHIDDQRRHLVRITRSFYIGTYEVTLGQFLAFNEDANYWSKWKSQGEPKGYGWGLTRDSGKYRLCPGAQNSPSNWGHPGQTSEHPAVNVSWSDATAFCDWLSRKEQKRYRLPSEAEWEYACRAGTATKYYNGNDYERQFEVGNVEDASLRRETYEGHGPAADDGFAFTAPVGKFRPNGFGLYDMHGNVWEWCADWYDSEYYAHSLLENPTGPETGDLHVIRGGSWLLGSSSAFRTTLGATDYYDSAGRWSKINSGRDACTGFRVVYEP
jgi:formylglycine-generating enzyme required for sulfatase activity